MVPRNGWAFVTCMDSRIDVARLFGGLAPGDAHVLRNAGGIVTDDTIRSLAVSQRVGQTSEIIVVHHTDCGLETLSDESFARQLEEESGCRAPWSVGAFTSPTDDVRLSVERLRVSPFLTRTRSISGYVYDVDAGALSEVVTLTGLSEQRTPTAGTAMWGGWW